MRVEVRQLHSKSALSGGLMLCVLLCAGRAAAFEEPAMCTEPVDDHPWSSADARQDVCIAPDPSLQLMLPAQSEPDAVAARESFARAQALYQSGDLDQAVLHLRVVERALPRIADRSALRRGELLEQLGLPAQACEAYSVARQSPERGVATAAEIAEARCLLDAFDKRGEAALQLLVRRYPNLGERHSLRLSLARLREHDGQLSAAATLLRAIDLEAPASPEAAAARDALAALAERGVRARPLSGLELADRTERLWRDADVETAAAEVDRLLVDPALSAEARGRLHVLAARIARQQGNWERVNDEVERARRAGAADVGKLVPPRPLTASDVAVAGAGAEADAERARYEKQVRALRGSTPLPKLSASQLRALFDLALRLDDVPLLDETTVALANKKGVVPAMRFEIAMRAAGVAGDDALATLLVTLLDVPSLRLPARYHLARAYERAGRKPEAQAAYTQVLAEDRSGTPYYALWADQRLRALGAASAAGTLGAGGSQPVAVPAGLVGLALREPAELEDGVADAALGVQGLDDFEAPVFGTGSSEPELDLALDAHARTARVRALLVPIVEQHAAAYPWLARALDLTELGLFDEAADELSEAYLAWRDAIGAPRLRSGLLALLTGSAPPRRPTPGAMRNARRALDNRTRSTLSAAAKALGDPGIGLRLGAFRPDSRPRAYAQLVEDAARRQRIDPNLLFAVMRVESIYNRRIISTAGAIGLMQIMPATGQRIALQMGVDGFKAADLLDPQRNVEFSAWYLASLLKRFDGSLPLAIASYNGGPHNVRLWMRESGPDMPLDAFLERIPFSQTHRYVRRVLTHYAAYRAQHKLPMTTISLRLPEPRTDEMAF